MPKFVPVRDTERSLAEQDVDGAEFAAHRQFDNPHSVLKNKKSTEQTDRGWAQGEVGWGVQRSFGGEEKDGHAQVSRYAEGENKMVKNSKGLWVKAKEIEPDDVRNEKKGMGRGNKGISVFAATSEGVYHDEAEIGARYNEKRNESRRDDGDYSSKRKQNDDRHAESDEDSRHHTSRRREQDRSRSRDRSRQRDDSRDHRRYKSSRRNQDRDRSSSRDRDLHRYRSSSRDRDRRRKEDKKYSDKRRSRSRSRSDSRDRRRHKKRHRADSEERDSKRHDRDRNKRRNRHSRSRSPLQSSDSDDRHDDEHVRATKPQTNPTEERKSRFEKSATNEPPLSQPVVSREVPVGLTSEVDTEEIRITAVQVINRFHEVYQSSHAHRLRDLRDLFHASISVSSLQNPDKVYLDGRDAVLIAFAKTVPMPTPVSKRIYFEATSKREDPNLEVTFVCDLHRPGTSPGLGDSQHDTFVLYECSGAQIVRIWGGNDASGCVQDEDLSMEGLLTKGQKNWQRVKNIVSKSVVFVDKGQSSWETTFCHYHNYDRMEVWGM